MSTRSEAASRVERYREGEVVFSEEEIRRRVGEMARQIGEAYRPEDEVLLVGLLKGSFIFMADLVRGLPPTLRVKVDFLVAESYGAGTTSSGEVRLLYDPEAELEGRHVILVEDILDSGTTMNRLVPLLEARRPVSLEVALLLHKHLAPELVKEPRWVGFDAPPDFLVGYGLDYNETYRNLPYIAKLVPWEPVPTGRRT